MNVPLFIARRYLFARKSHNVINVISAISAVGMAIGTAALVLILSVYNGFNSLIEKNLSDVSPDLMMVSSCGLRFFKPDTLEINRMLDDERVCGLRYVLEDKVFVSYDEKQSLALARGVEDEFVQKPEFIEHIYEGSAQLYKGDAPGAIVGSALAQKLGLHPRFVSPLKLYYPDRKSNFSPSNPMASTISANVIPTGLVSISSNLDAELIIVPLYVMQRLTRYRDDHIATRVEIDLKDNSRRAIRRFKDDYHGNFRLHDRYQQQPTLFKMLRYEKLAVFLILLFVVLIVALNIYGSLSMLIIEKKDDIGTLHAMGASDALVRRIFVMEGWLISLAGMAVGLVAGLALALLQQKFGFVRMPGNYLVDAYPVVLKLQDILLTLLSVATLGLVVALLSSRKKELVQ